MALALAVALPELVRSLVLAEPPLMPWLEHIPGGAPLAAAFYADAWRPAQLAFKDGDPEEGIRLFFWTASLAMVPLTGFRHPVGA